VGVYTYVYTLRPKRSYQAGYQLGSGLDESPRRTAEWQISGFVPRYTRSRQRRGTRSRETWAIVQPWSERALNEERSSGN